jgi:hypothetical protein
MITRRAAANGRAVEGAREWLQMVLALTMNLCFLTRKSVIRLEPRSYCRDEKEMICLRGLNAGKNPAVHPLH